MMLSDNVFVGLLHEDPGRSLTVEEERGNLRHLVLRDLELA